MLIYCPNLRAKYTNGFYEKDQDESRWVSWEKNEKTNFFRIIAVDYLRNLIYIVNSWYTLLLYKPLQALLTLKKDKVTNLGNVITLTSIHVYSYQM